MNHALKVCYAGGGKGWYIIERMSFYQGKEGFLEGRGERDRLALHFLSFFSSDLS